MDHNSHPTNEPEVPAALVTEHRAGWCMFTRATVGLCVAVAVVLLLMLFFFKAI